VQADAEIFELEIQAPQFYPSRPHRCNSRGRRLLSLRRLILLVVFFGKVVAPVGVSRIDFGFAERGIDRHGVALLLLDDSLLEIARGIFEIGQRFLRPVLR